MALEKLPADKEFNVRTDKKIMKFMIIKCSDEQIKKFSFLLSIFIQNL